MIQRLIHPIVFRQKINSKNIQNLVFQKYSIKKISIFGFLKKFNSKILFKTEFFLRFNSKKLFKTGFFLGFNSKKYSFNTKKGVPPTPSQKPSVPQSKEDPRAKNSEKGTQLLTKRGPNGDLTLTT